MGRKEYLDAKEKALASLTKALADKKVDERIQPILTLINRKEGYYTSSSCAGDAYSSHAPLLRDLG